MNIVIALAVDSSPTAAALERARIGRTGSTPIEDAKLRAFSELMQLRLTDGEVQFTKAYLCARIERMRPRQRDPNLWSENCSGTDSCEPADAPA